MAKKFCYSNPQDMQRDFQLSWFWITVGVLVASVILASLVTGLFGEFLSGYFGIIVSIVIGLVVLSQLATERFRSLPDDKKASLFILFIPLQLVMVAVYLVSLGAFFWEIPTPLLEVVYFSLPIVVLILNIKLLLKNEMREVFWATVLPVLTVLVFVITLIVELIIHPPSEE